MPSFPLMAPYTADASRYDELLTSDGGMRAHWKPVIERIEASGPDAVKRGVELARRLIVENGVTYNVYADPQGRDRPWQLDILPMILPAKEWQVIAAGVAQRARLLDGLLADLYGPQRLLAEGIVPPEIAFGHPNFLWPCCGLRPADGRWLHVYAVDLARASNGQWWVLGDRTQTPSGPGYALENRRIVSRVYGQMVDDLRVRSPGTFFATLREQLLGQADEDEAPLAVVLTPGPFNETYFEHAYLARQLGLPLVEGADLTVRGDTLYLKTFAGLRRVHAMLRRLDDDFCDPAELRADSALGVPGLLQVIRAGRVTLANALGTGVLESASWLGFLQPISDWLCGEALALPSVATWWCGERPALEQVIANLDRLVIKPTFPNQKFEPVFGSSLDRKARSELIERLRARPYAYVAQERVALSQSPVWGPNGLTARALALRVYAVATSNGYHVMPGGLARIATQTTANIVSNQRGGGSKDVWVLAADDAAEETDIPMPSTRRRSRNEDLPSRLVENLFWMGRYAERCEDKARLARSTLALDARSEAWKYAIAACEFFGMLAERGSLNDSLFDTAHAGAIAADLRRLEWSSTQARSRLSAEHWRAIGVLLRQFHEAAASRSDARETLDRLVLALSGLAGFALDDMTQDDGWRMLVLGRRLERIQFLATLFSSRLATAAMPSRTELEWWLDITGSTIAYRTRNLERARLAPVMQLLMRDAQNPRGLCFQCSEVHHLVAQLATSGIAPDESFGRALASLEEMDLGVLEGAGYTAIAARQEFARRLLALAEAATQLSDRLSMRHFSHTDSDLQVVAA